MATIFLFFILPPYILERRPGLYFFFIYFFSNFLHYFCIYVDLADSVFYLCILIDIIL